MANFAPSPGGLTGVPFDTQPITPSDSADLTYLSRQIRATTAGNIQVTTYGQITRVLAFAAGETRTICAHRIWSTNTTATGIEASY